ncbi:MAG: regulatory protein RecX [Saccharospirillaceae bacterium]|nr:recombination regulator RecX [Pseudomonadales bacterium]NRB78054.1 regulatory protein RecX [Saccharospirillaceae bacterium]
MAQLSPYNYCLYLLSKREHTVVQITQKLKLREVEQNEIDRCMQKLQNNKLQCDNRFCESMIRYYSGQLKGEQWIKHSLKQAGIGSNQIENAFFAADVNWLDALEKLINKKYGDIQTNDFKEKQKRQRYLLSKGYTYSQINEVLS